MFAQFIYGEWRYIQFVYTLRREYSYKEPLSKIGLGKLNSAISQLKISDFVVSALFSYKFILFDKNVTSEKLSPYKFVQNDKNKTSY